jgi:hypothetical protein
MASIVPSLRDNADRSSGPGHCFDGCDISYSRPQPAGAWPGSSASVVASSADTTATFGTASDRAHSLAAPIYHVSLSVPTPLIGFHWGTRTHLSRLGATGTLGQPENEFPYTIEYDPTALQYAALQPNACMRKTIITSALAYTYPRPLSIALSVTFRALVGG